MIVKNNQLLYGALLLCLPSIISADLSTLQYWDPIPFYNAANLNMPPDQLFCYGVKRRILHEDTQKHRRWGINVSPFVQRAIKAQQTDELYFGTTPTAGQQMSDFRGTPYLMGLFLGQDVNGNSIWGNASSPNKGVDTGLITDITIDTVNATLLPSFLQEAVIALNNCPNPPSITPAPISPEYDNAILYNTPSNNLNTSPSILSQGVLEQDQVYFGAFSVPLQYQKSGFRWELNFDISENIGFLARGGFCQITQRAFQAISLSALAPSKSLIDSSLPSLYTGLNTYANAKSVGGQGTGGNIPDLLGQASFNEWVTNNIDDLLDPVNGANYNIQTFSQPGIEDIQLLGFYRHPLMIHPADPNKYTSVMVTPYVMVGGTIPLAAVKDYSKLYALPFGNNSHGSVGGVAGVTFDFINSIEFGFEFGATGFFSKKIDNLPVPNHQLQRVLYPYRQDVQYSPGFNGQFAFIFNAFEFTHNTSFSFRYNYVQHMQDTIKLITPSKYFYPYYLEELTPWSSQMFIASLVFEIQPSVYLSMAWQGALSQKNAYCSNTILGSLNFLF